MMVMMMMMSNRPPARPPAWQVGGRAGCLATRGSQGPAACGRDTPSSHLRGSVQRARARPTAFCCRGQAGRRTAGDGTGLAVAWLLAAPFAHGWLLLPPCLPATTYRLARSMIALSCDGRLACRLCGAQGAGHIRGGGMVSSQAANCLAPSKHVFFFFFLCVDSWGRAHCPLFPHATCPREGIEGGGAEVRPAPAHPLPACAEGVGSSLAVMCLVL